ncbi:hypothetical protein SH668x_000239 [Planctomicrobium sp. SH668]|uniref:hypothetical protein n=1 Tax=Planctomicrobium sp. SH668 TaxID=3448126 RepID=UPI003F5B652C
MRQQQTIQLSTRDESELGMALTQHGIQSSPNIDPIDGRCIVVLAATLFLFAIADKNLAQADDLRLKNGVVLTGTARQVSALNLGVSRQNSSVLVAGNPFTVIDDGVRRFIIHRRNVAGRTEEKSAVSNVSFSMKHLKQARTSGFPVVGGFSSIEPFDDFGRRTVVLSTQKGMLPIIQGITDIRPDYSNVESLKYNWDYTIDTSTISVDTLRSLIEKTSDRNNPAELKAAALFYLQAQRYEEAQEEVRRIAQRFPAEAEWCKRYAELIGEFIARKGINEIERRREAGQHLLAYQFARNFPSDGVSAEILQSAEEIADEYEKAIANRDQIILQLDILQAELDNEHFERLKSLRVTLVDELHYERLNRLEPFLRTIDDATQPPQEKLALAYSGWIMGDAGAVTNLDEAIRLWDARFLVLEYLRLDQSPTREKEILASLSALEGITLQRVSTLIKNLPPPQPVEISATGSVHEFEFPASIGNKKIRYSVMLPPEYHPSHRYPMIVALKAEQRSYAEEIRWWGGDESHPGWAQRRGYIVIAPHYASENDKQYDINGDAREIVLSSVNHARQRLSINSDRIFLGGHGMGADACFDIGLSTPGVFAGVIPIVGIFPHEARPTWENAPGQSWYVVAGELDRNSLDKNAYPLDQMMKNGHDVIYCEYKSRGLESYFEELERIFNWMHTLRRVPLSETKKFDAKIVSSSVDSMHWIKAKGMENRLGLTNKLNSLRFEGTITPGGTIYISHPGKATTIWLSPENFDFENRSQIRVNLKQVYHDFIKPSYEAMLSDLAERGDRERLFWARVDL